MDKHTEVGDSIGHVRTLQEEFENFENKAKVTKECFFLIKGDRL